MAATREGDACVFVWAVVREAVDGASLLGARRYSPDAPHGVDELVPRAAAVFPLSRERFLAARRTGWPGHLRAVQALAGLVTGGAA